MSELTFDALSIDDTAEISTGEQATIFFDEATKTFKGKKENSIVDLESQVTLRPVEVLGDAKTISIDDNRKILINETGSSLITVPEIANGSGISFDVWNWSSGTVNLQSVDSVSTIREKNSLFGIQANGGKAIVQAYTDSDWQMSGDTVTDEVPLQIDGCRLWIDFSDSDSLTLNGLTVQAAADKSGFNNNIENLNTPEQPELITSAQNGLSVAFFNDSIFEFDTSLASLMNSDVTFYIMLKNISSTNNSHIMVAYNGSGNTRHGLYFNDPDSYRSYSRGVSVMHDIGNPPDMNQFHGYEYRRSSDVLNGLYFRPGRSDAVSNSVGSAVDANQMFFGANKIASTSSYDGWVGEILMYNRQLSADEREVLRDYLSQKWGTV